MKREVQRQERLPAFNLSGTELDLLWQRMAELFEGDPPVRRKLKLKLPNERLQFDDLAELKTYGRVRGRVTQFELEFTQGSRTLAVRSGGTFLRPSPIVEAESESEIWCAGALEAVRGVVRANRAWYWWFERLPFTLLFFVLSLLPLISSWLGWTIFKDMAPKTAASWFSIVLLLGFLSFSKEKVLPPSSITFTEEQNFVRRYGAEIGLILGLISIVLGVAALL
jgi:hypothetical protein